MIFIAYCISAVLVYFILSPLYFYELTQRPALFWKGVFGLCAVKGVDWALYMQLNEWTGPLSASIFCSLLMFGFQEYVDLRIKEKAVVFSPKLWTRAAFGLSTIVEGWIHLAVFNSVRGLIVFAESPYGGSREIWIGCANVVGHVSGVVSTYPFVSMRRRNEQWWEGFSVYFVRSTLAAFLISFFASFIE